MNIVLADDHKVVRQGLRSLLEADQEFKVIGEASDGLEAVQLVEKLQPDVLVLDMMMSGINGVEVTRQLGKRVPNTRVVILSMHNNEAYIVEALKAGAKAYVLKDSSSDELLQAVRRAAAGQRFLSAALSERAIDAYTRSTEPPPNPYNMLTTREREILQLIAQGLTASKIAKRLCVSPRTVDVHRANMMRKLNLKTHTEVIRYAIRMGLLPP